MLRKSQQGISFWGVLLIAPMVGFFILMGLKLIPVYMQDGAVSTALTTMSREPEGYPTAMAVKGTFAKRLEVNNVKDVTMDDLKVEREGTYYKVAIDYEISIPIVANLSVVAAFSHKVQVPAL